MTSITIPNSVRFIENNAFYNNKWLESVTIGSAVKSIGYGAFASCVNLTDVICNATQVPTTDAGAFKDSYIEDVTLHVPKSSVSQYKMQNPWSQFGTIEALDDNNTDVPGREKCAMPTISYTHGQLTFDSETEGVEFVSEITDADIKKHYDKKLALSVTYLIKVYAKKTGYNNSEVVTATLCWIDVDPKMEGIENGVANVKAMPVLIQGEEGVLHISGAPEGTAINVYEIGGQLVDSAKASSDITIISTTLPQGSIAIVKIGEKAVKVLMK